MFKFKISSLLVLFASSLFAMTIIASPAEADRRRSKIRGPGGTWTWGPDIPHIHEEDNPLTGLSEEAWGEAGRVAYQGAASTMSKRSPTGEPLDPLLKNALRPHFGGLVDRVTLHWGTPGLDKWSANQIGINLSGTESAGQTYGHDIYLTQQKPSSYTQDTIKLIIHEMTHSEQYERYSSSLSNFGYHYFKKYKQAGQSYENNQLEREARDKANGLIGSVSNSYSASQNPFMIISDKDPSLAINAIDGARHNGPIALHQECRNDNPDCLWYYENGMLISARDRGLAVNALNGARHLGDLVLRSDCNASNPDCTWTYRDGMFVSDKDPSLAINAYQGARHGVHLKLYKIGHQACEPSNPDCTWTKQ